MQEAAALRRSTARPSKTARRPESCRPMACRCGRPQTTARPSGAADICTTTSACCGSAACSTTTAGLHPRTLVNMVLIVTPMTRGWVEKPTMAMLNILKFRLDVLRTRRQVRYHARLHVGGQEAVGRERSLVPLARRRRARRRGRDKTGIPGVAVVHRRTTRLRRLPEERREVLRRSRVVVDRRGRRAVLLEGRGPWARHDGLVREVGRVGAEDVLPARHLHGIVAEAVAAARCAEGRVHARRHPCGPFLSQLDLELMDLASQPLHLVGHLLCLRYGRVLGFAVGQLLLQPVDVHLGACPYCALRFAVVGPLALQLSWRQRRDASCACREGQQSA